MRILMLAQFYWPIIGGEERMVQDLSIELAMRGHQVAVGTLWHPGLPEQEVQDGIHIYRFKGLVQRLPWLYAEQERRHAPPWPDLEIARKLVRLSWELQPEIVHAHNWLLHSFLPVRTRNRERLVVTLHDYSAVCATKRLMFLGQPCTGPALAKCLTCASRHYGALKGYPVTLAVTNAARHRRSHNVDMYLPVSEAVAKLTGLHASGLPYRVIPNFIPDDAHVRQVRPDSRLEQLPTREFLLCVGDLSHDKGTDTLLKAYAGLPSAPPLVLIGRNYLGPDDILPANVTILKSWPHELVMEAWRRSTIALVPSSWPEPFGLVAIEAMSAGRPVIATRTGGLTDIIEDGVTGVLTEPGNVASMRAAIARLLADRELRANMGVAAASRAKEYRASRIVPRVLHVYTDLLRTQR